MPPTFRLLSLSLLLLPPLRCSSTTTNSEAKWFFFSYDPHPLCEKDKFSLPLLLPPFCKRFSTSERRNGVLHKKEGGENKVWHCLELHQRKKEKKNSSWDGEEERKEGSCDFFLFLSSSLVVGDTGEKRISAHRSFLVLLKSTPTWKITTVASSSSSSFHQSLRKLPPMYHLPSRFVGRKGRECKVGGSGHAHVSPPLPPFLNWLFFLLLLLTPLSNSPFSFFGQ